jgi:hypothetical protein
LTMLNKCGNLARQDCQDLTGSPFLSVHCLGQFPNDDETAQTQSAYGGQQTKDILMQNPKRGAPREGPLASCS